MGFLKAASVWKPDMKAHFANRGIYSLSAAFWKEVCERSSLEKIEFFSSRLFLIHHLPTSFSFHKYDVREWRDLTIPPVPGP